MLSSSSFYMELELPDCISVQNMSHNYQYHVVPAPSSSRFSGASDLESRPQQQGQGVPKGSPIRSEAEDAAFSSRSSARPSSSASSGNGPSARPSGGASNSRPAPRSSRPRDNSSRFDD